MWPKITYLYSKLYQHASYLILKLNMRVILLVCLVALALCRIKNSLTNWNFTYEKAKGWYPARIPSSLAWDLIDNKLVSNDPYFRDNFLQFYDFQTQSATYKTTFNVSSTNFKNQFLIFQGLDTHAQVELNGKIILSANNMFRRYEVPVTFLAQNTLIVRFASSAIYDQNQAKIFQQKNGFHLPANYSFTRKAAYQYGWDWGPRVLSVGIWKEVYAVLYNDLQTKNFKFIHSPITKTTKQISCQISMDLFNLDARATYEVSASVIKSDKVIYKSNNFQVKSAISTTVDLPFIINKDIWSYVWWTWDLGQPNLIDISFNITNLNTKEVVTRSMTTGIRTIKVIQQSNKAGNETSFTFNLNGYDVFMRGGNYIPPQMSMARTNLRTYQKIKQYALFARFNMIRLWGGGQFQKDDFYEQMDRNGILIWHDLMFACALYPSSSDILSNIEAEMRDNVKRLRHHPSIGLWNGNNQVWIGWQEWGWQKDLTQEQKKFAVGMYQDIFQGVLPRVLKQEHPSVYYWETSPSQSSWTTKSIASGDIHSWRVWGGSFPIQEYQQFIGRFNSQYGMQSMPQISSIQRFTRIQDRFIDSQVMRLHQRHPFGDKYLPGYTFNYSGTTTNITRFAYFSQVMQAYALQLAISSLRLNKPFNMGSLYWQMNDVWPVSSWATVDYYGTYKAAHYRVRHLHQQLLMHVYHQKTGDYAVYITNDYNKTFKCQCLIQILTYKGETTKIKSVVQKTVHPFQRVFVKRLLAKEVHNYTDSGFIKTALKTVDSLQSNHLTFFKTMKNRPNFDPQLTYSIEGSKLTITTKYLASYVWIYRKLNDNYLQMNLSDNYFTMSPGEKVVIDVGDIPRGQIFVTCYEIQFNKDKQNDIEQLTS